METPQHPEGIHEEQIPTPEKQSMPEGRLWVLVGVLLSALAVALWAVMPPIVKNDSERSPEFRQQERAAFDAIERYQNSSGLAVSIAKLDMDRELDALDRTANNPKEENAVSVLRRYRFTIEIADVDPSEANVAARNQAYADVLSVLY